MNGTLELETMARAIFRDLFVDFGPTRAKAEGRAPYLWDLFSDALDDEDKPVGWELSEIGKEVRRLKLEILPICQVVWIIPKRKGWPCRPFASDSRRGGQRTRNRPAPQLARMYSIWLGVSTARFAVSGYGRDAAVL